MPDGQLRVEQPLPQLDTLGAPLGDRLRRLGSGGSGK